MRRDDYVGENLIAKDLMKDMPYMENLWNVPVVKQTYKLPEEMSCELTNNNNNNNNNEPLKKSRLLPVTIRLSSPSGEHSKTIELDRKDFSFNPIQSAAVEYFGISEEEIYLFIDERVPFVLNSKNIMEYKDKDVIRILVHSRKTFME
jgi:hypothetical protein